LEYKTGVNLVVTTIGADIPLLEECLTSIETNKTESCTQTVTVVDDGHSSQVRDLCKSRGVSYVRTKMMYGGISKAVNTALESIEPPLSCIGLLHDDSSLLENSNIEAMVDVLKKHDEIAIVVPKVLFPRLNIAHTYITFSKNSDGQIGMQRPFFQWYRNHPGANVQAFVAGSQGGLFFIDRNFLESINGLDTQFFPAFFEDIDLCLSANSAGKKILYMPKAEFTHHTAVSINKANINVQQVGGVNLQKMYEKWKDNEGAYLLNEVKSK
jgi:GT2 family glycosyltransferase